MRWRFHGSDLFLQHILQVLDWIEILGIWRPCEHLKLIVVLLFAFWCPAVDTLGPKSSMVNMGTMNDLWKCSTIHNKLWCTVYSDMFSSVCSTTAHMLDRTTQASLRFPRASMTLLLVHHCSFVEPLGIDSDHYRLGTPQKSCSDPVVNPLQFGPRQTRWNPYACPFFFLGSAGWSHRSLLSLQKLSIVKWLTKQEKMYYVKVSKYAIAQIYPAIAHCNISGL